MNDFVYLGRMFFRNGRIDGEIVKTDAEYCWGGSMSVMNTEQTHPNASSSGGPPECNIWRTDQSSTRLRARPNLEAISNITSSKNTRRNSAPTDRANPTCSLLKTTLTPLMTRHCTLPLVFRNPPKAPKSSPPKGLSATLFLGSVAFYSATTRPWDQPPWQWVYTTRGRWGLAGSAAHTRHLACPALATTPVAQRGPREGTYHGVRTASHFGPSTGLVTLTLRDLRQALGPQSGFNQFFWPKCQPHPPYYFGIRDRHRALNTTSELPSPPVITSPTYPRYTLFSGTEDPLLQDSRFLFRSNHFLQIPVLHSFQYLIVTFPVRSFHIIPCHTFHSLHSPFSVISIGYPESDQLVIGLDRSSVYNRLRHSYIPRGQPLSISFLTPSPVLGSPAALTITTLSFFLPITEGSGGVPLPCTCLAIGRGGKPASPPSNLLPSRFPAKEPTTLRYPFEGEVHSLTGEPGTRGEPQAPSDCNRVVQDKSRLTPPFPTHWGPDRRALSVLFLQRVDHSHPTTLEWDPDRRVLSTLTGVPGTLGLAPGSEWNRSQMFGISPDCFAGRAGSTLPNPPGPRSLEYGNSRPSSLEVESLHHQVHVNGGPSPPEEVVSQDHLSHQPGCDKEPQWPSQP
uniref:Uncharacterized protein n=1 Tax=Timema bartmani TaxID=61472 RepID=A0A7R9F532_9NEOP|nr:unnamed protein product [Timema bartmani]